MSGSVHECLVLRIGHRVLVHPVGVEENGALGLFIAAALVVTHYECTRPDEDHPQFWWKSRFCFRNRFGRSRRFSSARARRRRRLCAGR